MGEDRQGADSTPPGRKLAVSEAAAVLGISAEAVRSRIKRGTLESTKEGSTVYVLLAADQTPPEPRPGADPSPSDSTALISAKDETIAALREQLEAERQAHAETRQLFHDALQKLPAAIEPPREPPEAPQTATEQPGRVEPQAPIEGPQRALERPWWRRILGG